MNNLWPDFSNETDEKNETLEIIREQAKLLQGLTKGKVKASFSKIEYKYDAQSVTDNLSNIVYSIKEQMCEEIPDLELAGKENANRLFTTQLYRFEIYNNTYRFRVFRLAYSQIYPITFFIDEGIAEEIKTNREQEVQNNTEVRNLLSQILRSRKLVSLIYQLMSI